METLRAHWMPVYIEPIPFSGERLCAAVAFIADNGQTKVINTLPAHAVQCLFGQDADGVSRMAGQITESLKTHADASNSLDAWRAPLSGVYCGTVKTVCETSLDAAIETVIANVSSFAQAEPPPKAVEQSSIKWAKAVQAAVLSHAPSAGDWFNVQLADAREGKITVGFFNGKLAAEFAAVNPQHTWGSQSATVFRKLVTLAIARRHASLFVPERTEILIKVPARESIDDRVRERLDNLLWDAERAASSTGAQIKPYTTPQSAAQHLIQGIH